MFLSCISPQESGVVAKRPPTTNHCCFQPVALQWPGTQPTLATCVVKSPHARPWSACCVWLRPSLAMPRRVNDVWGRHPKTILLLVTPWFDIYIYFHP